MPLQLALDKAIMQSLFDVPTDVDAATVSVQRLLTSVAVLRGLDPANATALVSEFFSALPLAAEPVILAAAKGDLLPPQVWPVTWQCCKHVTVGTASLTAWPRVRPCAVQRVASEPFPGLLVSITGQYIGGGTSDCEWPAMTWRRVALFCAHLGSFPSLWCA